MTTKTTVAEFRDFFLDEKVWMNGAWYDDLEISIKGSPLAVDGVDWSRPPEVIPLTATLTISGGVLFIPKTMDSHDAYEFNLESEFRKWRKAKVSTTLAVTVPNENLEQFKAAVMALGAKIG